MAHNDDDIEVWISQVPGVTSVSVEDVRTGKARSIKVKGTGSVMRIAKEHRELVEERIEDLATSPFRNGRLLLRNGAQLDAQAMSNEDLASLFALDMGDFADVVAGLSEVNVRRLKELAVTENAGIQYVEHIKDLIAKKWPIGGDTPSNKEARGEAE